MVEGFSCDFENLSWTEEGNASVSCWFGLFRKQSRSFKLTGGVFRVL